ncbi:MAG: homoserine kinase [Vampirovibrionales bacterium]
MSVRMCQVQVPATSANLGAGFDSFGMAFELFNRFEFRLIAPQQTGVPPQFTDAPDTLYPMEGASWHLNTREQNILTQAMYYVWHHVWHRPLADFPALEVVLTTHIPPARGLGSSATALVAGLLACNTLLAPIYQETPLNMTELIAVACHLEGHPDNTTPALLGKVCLCRTEETLSAATSSLALPHVHVVHLPWVSTWQCVLCIPENAETSTKASRAVLPTSYAREEVITTLRQASYIALGLALPCRTTLAQGLSTEVLHQPYRTPSLPHWDTIKTWQSQWLQNTIGQVLSGSGPTVLWIGEGLAQDALHQLQEHLNPFEVTVRPLEINTTGASVLTSH